MKKARPADLADRATAVGEYQTVVDLMRHGVSLLTRSAVYCGHGNAGVWDECQALIQFALSLPPEHFEVFLPARLALREREAIVALFEARCAQRQPTAYLTGEAWLGGVCFKSDDRALVPRSLIAEAMGSGLTDWLQAAPATVLDLCCGGGSLAILAALAWPQARVCASDLSASALALARENVDLHGLDSRIELIEADLLGGVAGRRFDLVLCNPPYVNAESMLKLPAEYRAEPQLALAAGTDGMDIIRQLLARLAEHLEPDGALLLEIGHEADHFEAAFPHLEFSYIPVTQGERMLVWMTGESLRRAGDAGPLRSVPRSGRRAKPGRK